MPDQLTTTPSSFWDRPAVRLVDALMLARGGVALADSADASRCYPDLWPSPAAARQAFHRQRRVTGAEVDSPGRNRHAPLRRATYQRAGAGKRPASLFFDPAVVAPDELRAWLQERVGPLARFDLEPPGPPPSPPPAPEPPGRPLEPAVGAEGASAPAPAANGPAGAQTAAGAAAAPQGGPHPSTAAPAPSTAPHSAELEAVRLLRQRLRLNALVQRLRDARPKREHGVRQLDWAQWEDAAREAAGLPSAAWAAWRAKLGTGGARP